MTHEPRLSTHGEMEKPAHQGRVRAEVNGELTVVRSHRDSQRCDVTSTLTYPAAARLGELTTSTPESITRGHILSHHFGSRPPVDSTVTASTFNKLIIRPDVDQVIWRVEGCRGEQLCRPFSCSESFPAPWRKTSV
ncbi:hypothetical protein PSHT_09597 [Puccinia striiformis]|uniref:Uncharacterized protein n=3 Tax=Puccinia striiformis TaxID=27350 RepID=A0A0L0VTZ7_9BASI|nr:hypothetical protein PSTG_03973 [Puccinia striiformis f. sp. tritici PST-78]POW08272.1 hypothetical protein PSHT_09597 [Puccinia striiformis]POW13221.1 hypothetical protein PSTT_03967 [Puccinia striiformis]